MALLNKIFKRQVSASNQNTKSNNQQCRRKCSSQKVSELQTNVPENPKYIDGHHILTKDDVKLVIVKHHDQYGGRVLFDSSNQPQQNAYHDYIFGSSLNPSKSTFTKIHVFNNPSELMFSHSFTPHHKITNNKTAECGVFDFYGYHELPQQDHTYNDFSSLPISITNDLNKSIDTFSRRKEGRWVDDEDNNRGREVLSSSLASPGHAFRSVQCNYRRSTETKCKVDSEFVQSLPLKKRPLKMGFAIVFRLPNHAQASQSIKDFFFTHLHILTSTVEKIELVVCDKKFIEKLISLSPDKHYDFFKLHTDKIMRQLMNFYSFPRLQDPVWLTSSLLSPKNSSSNSLPTSSTSSQQPSSFVLPSQHLCHSILTPFIKDFVSVCDKCYNRSSKFFFGSLLTATLTHHLSWVSNILPNDDDDDDEEEEEEEDEDVAYLGFRHKKYVNPIERELYNLYGTVGFPRCVSKTVIVGKKVVIMKKLLRILSHFIRSSNLYIRSKDHFSTRAPLSGLSTNSSNTSLDTNFSSASSDNLTSHASSTINLSSKNISKSTFYLNELTSSLKTVNTYASCKGDMGCLNSKDSGYCDDACQDNVGNRTNSKSKSTFYVDTPPYSEHFYRREKNIEINLKKEMANKLPKKEENVDEKLRRKDKWVVCVEEEVKEVCSEKEVVRNVRSEYFVERNKLKKDDLSDIMKTTSGYDEIYTQSSTSFRMNEIKKTLTHEEEISPQKELETPPKEDRKDRRDLLDEGIKTRRTLSPPSISTTPVLGRSSESINTLTGINALVDSFGNVSDEKCEQGSETLEATNNVCDNNACDANIDDRNKPSEKKEWLEEALEEIMMSEEYQESCVGDITTQQETMESSSASNEEWDVVEDSLDNLLDGPIKIQLDFKLSLISNASQEGGNISKKLSNKISSGDESLPEADKKYDKKQSVSDDDKKKLDDNEDEDNDDDDDDEEDDDDGGTEVLCKGGERALHDSQEDDLVLKLPQFKPPLSSQLPTTSKLSTTSHHSTKSQRPTTSHHYTTSHNSTTSQQPTTSKLSTTTSQLPSTSHEDKNDTAPQKKRGFTIVPMPDENFFKNEALKLEKTLAAQRQNNQQEAATKPPKTTASTFYVDYESQSPSNQSSASSSNDNIPSTSKGPQHHSVQGNNYDSDLFSKKFTNNYSFKLLPTNQNITRSLLGDHCTEYTPDFVLHSTTDRSFLTPPFTSLHQDLIASFKVNLLENPIDASLSIVADVDNWSVQLFSCAQDSISSNSLPSPTTIISSQLILKLIDTLYGLAKLTGDPFVWFSIIEDHLKRICIKSQILAEYIRIHGMLCSQSLAQTLGFDVSDLPLLLAVVGVHSPHILLILNKNKKNKATS